MFGCVVAGAKKLGLPPLPAAAVSRRRERGHDKEDSGGRLETEEATGTVSIVYRTYRSLFFVGLLTDS
jgi:hypothetical protein